MPKLTTLVRYPVKGFNGQTLNRVDLVPGQGFPLDRAYAVENGGSRFDSQHPKWLPKIGFLMLMRHERLAAFEVRFDDTDHTLTILRDGKQLARGCLQTKLGRQMIEQFLSEAMKHELRGPPRIVSADGHSFTDIAAKAVHLVNLQSVNDLSRTMGQDLDPLRFRANIYFDGLAAWEELKLVGKTVSCGSASIKIFAETARCEATSVDLKTASRGPSIPSILERTWGHSNLGVYGKVVSAGTIAPGDEIQV